MKSISSRDNPLYKELKHLAGSPSASRKAGRTLLEGVHLCQSYLAHAGLPRQCVLSESALANSEVAQIVQRCDSQGVPCVVLPHALFHALSQVEHGIGLLFVIDIPAAVDSSRLDAPAVLLDSLQDPGNLGSILRTAAAAGIARIYCGSGTASCWSPKVLRAGMGAHFLLSIVENVDLSALIDQAKLPVLATSSHAAQPLYDIDLRQPVAWLFGNEGQGIAPALLAKASRRVAVPHIGAVESLNVAACAAVCLFEQVRQQHKPAK